MKSLKCNLPSRSESRRLARGGFTLTELLIVMGILVLLLAMAVPAFRAMSGQHSVAAAQNNISAALVRAREEAVGIQEHRGILFYLDKNTDRVVAALVRQVPVRASTSSTFPSTEVWLDLSPTQDILMLPVGIRAQAILGSVQMNTGTPPTRKTDGYLGFNGIPVPVTVGKPQTSGTTDTAVGAMILFDGEGRLVNKGYGFARFDMNDQPTPMFYLLMGQGAAIPSLNNRTDVPVNFVGSANPPVAVQSQFGLALFDVEAFRNSGYSDGDPVIDPAITYTGVTPNESDEEAWTDQNATPILINRYNGTLIVGR